jgi:hypothetical protein
MPALLRPGFGPTLPSLLQQRFGIPPRTTIIVGTVTLLVLVGGGLGAYFVLRDAQYVHRQDPVFNLLYDDGVLRRAEPRAGEVVRLQGRRGRVSVAVSVKVLRVPPFRGDTGKALLPLLAERRLSELRRRYPDLVLREEARSTVNDSPGYELAYRVGPPGRRTFWREILVVPDEDSPTLGAHLFLENRRPDRIGDPGKDLIETAKGAFRSFNFGTHRR